MCSMDKNDAKELGLLLRKGFYKSQPTLRIYYVQDIQGCLLEDTDPANTLSKPNWLFEVQLKFQFLCM